MNLTPDQQVEKLKEISKSEHNVDAVKMTVGNCTDVELCQILMSSHVLQAIKNFDFSFIDKMHTRIKMTGKLTEGQRSALEKIALRFKVV